MSYLKQFFKYDHLPPHLQKVSKMFSILADGLDELPDNPEKTTALRKLLEAKDCAVRAAIFEDNAPMAMADIEEDRATSDNPMTLEQIEAQRQGRDAA